MRTAAARWRFLAVTLLGLAVLPGLAQAGLPQAKGQVEGEDEPELPVETSAAAAVAPVQMQWVEREFWLHSPGSGPNGMDALEVWVRRPGKHPLAVLTHGTAATAEARAQVTPWGLLPQAIWFARRGYVVIVVARRGYGRSGGVQDVGGCGRSFGSFEDSGNAAADDLRAAMKYAESLPEVDTSSIISAGVSTGGFTQVALTAQAPPGLKAAISFAGGRGGDGTGNNCDLSGLVSAFHSFGKKSRTPMLWIYAENDKWFPPKYAVQFDKAFKSGGGQNEFVMAPPDGVDGHGLFGHVSAWSPTVEAFLKEKNLLPEAELFAPPSVPKVDPPAGLDDRGQAAFRSYLVLGPSKAFATDGKGSWGVSTGRFTQEIADSRALDQCKKMAHGSCELVAKPSH